MLAIEEGVALLDSFASEPRLVASIDHGPSRHPMSDEKCDPQGRFWAGSMAYDCLQASSHLRSAFAQEPALAIGTTGRCQRGKDRLLRLWFIQRRLEPPED